MNASMTAPNRWVLLQNGFISEALALFKANASRHFEGVEACAICYSVIAATDRSLPTKICRTCKNSFHPSCLYKWFSTSRGSSCPLCRSVNTQSIVRVSLSDPFLKAPYFKSSGQHSKLVSTCDLYSKQRYRYSLHAKFHMTRDLFETLYNRRLLMGCMALLCMLDYPVCGSMRFY